MKNAKCEKRAPADPCALFSHLSFLILHYSESRPLRPAPMPRPARVRLLVVGVALGLGAAAAAYFFWPTQQVGPPREPDVASDVEPPDPRQTFATRFRNVHPDVIYVGDAACRPCHKD